MSKSWCQLPDGYTFALENLQAIKINGATIRLFGTGGNNYDFIAGNNMYAQSILLAIAVVMQTPAPWTVITGSQPATWVDIAPDTATVGTFTGFNVEGTNFLLIVTGGFALRANDRNGHITHLNVNAGFVTSTAISVDSQLVGAFPVAGIYYVEFTTDNGNTWTDTGLIITAS